MISFYLVLTDVNLLGSCSWYTTVILMSWPSRTINQQIVTLIKKHNSNGFTHDYTYIIFKCKKTIFVFKLQNNQIKNIKLTTRVSNSVISSHSVRSSL
jgi:hypothetical protein